MSNRKTLSNQMVTGRPRPGSKYATPEGARRLRAELDELWLVERPAVTRAVSEAAAMGDRSENAEYIYGKRRLREIDRRVRFLRQRLDGLKVVAGPPSDRGRAFFGAWVTIEDAEGRHAPSPHRRAGRVRPRAGLPQHGCAARPRLARQARRRRDLEVQLPGEQCSRRVIDYRVRVTSRSTRMFLNCHGSLSSRSSGNRRPRSNSGVQSVYLPTTGPR